MIQKTAVVLSKSLGPIQIDLNSSYGTTQYTPPPPDLLRAGISKDSKTLAPCLVRAVFVRKDELTVNVNVTEHHTSVEELKRGPSLEEDDVL